LLGNSGKHVTAIGRQRPLYSVYQYDWSGFKRPYRLWKCTQKYVSHMERKSRFSSFDRMRNPTQSSLSPPRSVTLRKENRDSGAVRVLCAAVCEALNQLFLLSGLSGDNFMVIPHLLTALGVGISSFEQWDAFVKGRGGRPRVSEESVERARQSFLRSSKKSVRHASRALKMSTMTAWRLLRKRLETKPYRRHLAQFLRSFRYTVYYFVRRQVQCFFSFVVDEVVSSEYFDFPCQFLFHRLLHNYHPGLVQ
jgi:hypothetical protein